MRDYERAQTGRVARVLGQPHGQPLEGTFVPFGIVMYDAQEYIILKKMWVERRQAQRPFGRFDRLIDTTNT